MRRLTNLTPPSKMESFRDVVKAYTEEDMTMPFRLNRDTKDLIALGSKQLSPSQLTDEALCIAVTLKVYVNAWKNRKGDEWTKYLSPQEHEAMRQTADLCISIMMGVGPTDKGHQIQEAREELAALY